VEAINRLPVQQPGAKKKTTDLHVLVLYLLPNRYQTQPRTRLRPLATGTEPPTRREASVFTIPTIFATACHISLLPYVRGAAHQIP
jgi:hypothetical protein